MLKYLILGSFLISCSHHPHGKNVSNQHMHKRDHQELIKSFDDPQRDAWQRPDLVLKHMGPLEGKKIIDIGAGSGYFTKYFLKNKANVVAADVDEKFLKHIRHSFSEARHPNLEIRRVDYNDPKMGEEEFDFAFTSNTYHHIDNRNEYLKKVNAGLKSRGQFVVLDYRPGTGSSKTQGPPEAMRIPAPTVVNELVIAGFDHIRVIIQDFPQHYLIIGQKR